MDGAQKPKQPPEMLFDTRVPFFRGITFKVIIGLLVLDASLVLGIITVMNRVGHNLVQKESRKLIQVTGNSVVLELHSRLEKIEALTRGLANAGEQLYHDETQMRRVIENMLDFDLDFDVAGGGLWFEPHVLKEDEIRRSFFWGRDEGNHLRFFNDYNRPGPTYDEQRFRNDPAYRTAFKASPGYHNEEWYVVVRHLSEAGRGFWSRSYMDPYSKQPMVTVTVAMRDEAGQFLGVATVDLKLEGLHSQAERWSERTGGYVFLLDRNDKFLSFPRPDIARAIGKTGEFTTVSHFAETNQSFQPIADTLAQMKRDLKKKALGKAEFSKLLARKIDRSSYQVDLQEAELIAAVVANPFHNGPRLLRSLSLPDDLLLGRPSVASFFHVPDAYWKVVIVKPASDYVAVSRNIRQTLLRYILVIIVIIFIMASSYQLFMVVRPIKTITQKIAVIGRQLQAGKAISDIEEREVHIRQQGEIGLLAHLFNGMTLQLAEAHELLRGSSEELAIKVEERTRELQESQAIALQNAHAAGMAEIATDVLHNIGNLLNSLNISVEEMSSRLDDSHLESYKMAATLLDQHIDDQATFLTQDPKGQKLPAYFIAFARIYENNHDRLARILEDIREEVETIKMVILTQHRYAQGRDFYERIDLFKVTDDAVNLEAPSLKEKGIKVVRKYRIVPHIFAPKTKVMHILINLLKNGREAIEVGGYGKAIYIEIGVEDGQPFVSIKDSGVGISEENRNKIFTHGFTTKEQGTGFGLHYCANVAQEMGGRITINSEGADKGSTFTLYFSKGAWVPGMGISEEPLEPQHNPHDHRDPET